MAVDVGCDAVRRVSEQLVYDLEMSAGRNQRRGGAVPKRVHANTSQPGTLSDARERSSTHSWVCGCPNHRGEHQVRMFLPRRPDRRCKPLSSLRRPVALQRVGNRGGEWHEPPRAFSFRLVEHELMAARDSVHRTRPCPAARSTSLQCNAKASPRRRPVPSMSTMRGSNRSPCAACSSRPTSSTVR
jgi:hypothetical protein